MCSYTIFNSMLTIAGNQCFWHHAYVLCATFACLIWCTARPFLLAQIECRLCLTLHNNEGNYLAHTQVQQQQQQQQ
jgi:hypothetical protein